MNLNNMTTIGYALLIQYWNGSNYSPDYDRDGLTVYMDMAEAQRVMAEIVPRGSLRVRANIIQAEIK